MKEPPFRDSSTKFQTSFGAVQDLREDDWLRVHASAVPAGYNILDLEARAKVIGVRHLFRSKRAVGRRLSAYTLASLGVHVGIWLETVF